MEHSRHHRGFTLIEMLVVLAIIVVVTTVVITSQSAFNKTLILSNTAYDIGLAIRSAQTYGLGSRIAGVTSNAGYGLHFEIGSPSSFTLFADTYPAPSTSSVCHPTSSVALPTAQPGNCTYESNQAERVNTFLLGNGITIQSFCVYAGSSWTCTGTGSNLTMLDIIFARPNPDPFMAANGTYSASTPVTRACLLLTSRQGGARYVSVGAAGNINGNAASCP